MQVAQPKHHQRRSVAIPDLEWNSVKLKNLDLVSPLAKQKQSSFLVRSASEKALITHPLARCGTRSTSSPSRLGTDVGVVLEEVVPYSIIACGAIDSMIH